MVKIYCISVLYKGPTTGTWLKSAYDLQSFNFFQRGSVQEFMSFFCKTIVERSFPGTRQSVKEGGLYINVLNIFVAILELFFRIFMSSVCQRR